MKRYMLYLMMAGLLLAACGCGAAVRPVITIVGETRALPVVMYHSVLKDPARRGEYVVSPDALCADIEWLFSNGYEPVRTSELVDFVYGRGTLPEKPVLLTFDDGYLNNLTYVLPILNRYDCTAVMAVVGVYAQTYTETPDPNPNYAHVSWEEIRALRLSGRFEIANHTYNMHAQWPRMGCARVRGEDEAAYRQVLSADVIQMQEALQTHTGAAASTFVYPYGAVDAASTEVLKRQGFVCTLTCAERVNRIVAGDPESLWELGRFNRSGDESTDAFMQKLTGRD